MRAARILGTVLIAAIVSAIPAAGAVQDGLRINSDSMVIEEGAGNVRFTGNVTLLSGDVIIKCDSLTVFSRSSDPDSVKMVIATGNVSFTRGGDRIVAQRAEFDIANSRVVLEGSALFKRGSDNISAGKIIYDLKKGVASFSGAVDALISPTVK